MPVVKGLAFTAVFMLSCCLADGQQTPLNPISYWVFTPYLYNPAMVGSKDYLSVDINAAFEGKSNALVLAGNTRLSKYAAGYFGNQGVREFKNFGVAGSAFKNTNGPSQNIGASLGGSLQIPLNMRKLSFLSFGVSVKGIYNTLDTSSGVQGSAFKKSIYPDLDVGIYFYGTNIFAGLSATDLLSNEKDPETVQVREIPVTRQYYFTAGYKILLSKSLNIVLEPSVLIYASDSTLRKISDNINPILKLYLEDFCIGSYFLNNGKIAFFFQYKYSKFYVGAFFELPKKSPYFKRTPLVEVTAGINLQIDKSRYTKHSHW